ncbi:transposase [Alicyclobacillus fodiniaquatilis]|uniref:Transposase n=1 Tax=Alicyclobacillus fodiniaquatilis TaxID=1661150 RepID=A0ABW4JP39_9BACL
MKTVKQGDLCIRDLGYFCLADFREMEQRGAFYVSRLKLNVRVYEKNPIVEYFQNGNVKKDSVYKEINLEAIMDRLQPGEIMELDKVYLGKTQKFPTRLVIYKLTPEQTEKRAYGACHQRKEKEYFLSRED